MSMQGNLADSGPDVETLYINIQSKSFSAKDKVRVVFQDFELKVSPGEFVCVLGTSGCGKSTLLRMVAGLDQDFEGDIQIGNKLVLSPGRDRSLVFQQARLLPWMTVSQNINFALDQIHTIEDRTEMIENSLRLVGLEHARDMKTFHLSGGMKTRVALARAIADPPNMLLLDEPFSALDFYTREAVHNNITQIQDQHNFTTLMVTHDLDEAIYLSDRIVVLTDPPANITADIRIELERPRERGDARFQEYLARLLNAMRAARDEQNDKEHKDHNETKEQEHKEKDKFV